MEGMENKLKIIRSVIEAVALLAFGVITAKGTAFLRMSFHEMTATEQEYTNYLSASIYIVAAFCILMGLTEMWRAVVLIREAYRARSKNRDGGRIFKFL